MVTADNWGDYVFALAEWQPLAEAGDAFAQFILAEMYYGGEGVQQDKAEAARLYRLAAKQGFAEAQHNLALMYEVGQGVQQDKAEAAVCIGLLQFRA